ncbi:hypothetical protein BDQ17DRAFT_1438542 [Cyathus striatus]|nr:hypothetical protein BDQ17DRAFT_1438542 [Cyathus striatus]
MAQTWARTQPRTTSHHLGTRSLTSLHSASNDTTSTSAITIICGTRSATAVLFACVDGHRGFYVKAWPLNMKGRNGGNVRYRKLTAANGVEEPPLHGRTTFPFTSTVRAEFRNVHVRFPGRNIPSTPQPSSVFVFVRLANRSRLPSLGPQAPFYSNLTNKTDNSGMTQRQPPSLRSYASFQRPSQSSQVST